MHPLAYGEDEKHLWHLHGVTARSGIFQLKANVSSLASDFVDEFFATIGVNASDFLCRKTQKTNVVNLLTEMTRSRMLLKGRDYLKFVQIVALLVFTYLEDRIVEMEQFCET
jgi:hypothetical protein